MSSRANHFSQCLTSSKLPVYVPERCSGAVDQSLSREHVDWQPKSLNNIINQENFPLTFNFSCHWILVIVFRVQGSYAHAAVKNLGPEG